VKWLFALTLTLAGAVALAMRRNAQAQAEQGDDSWPVFTYDTISDPDPVAAYDEPDQLANPLQELAVTLDPRNLFSAGDSEAASRNVRAFLDMIAYSEGADYNTLVGGGRFDDFSRHPRLLIDVRPGLQSTAAGRYQFLARTWDALAARLNLPDFSPASQDLAAIELIREKNALRDVQAGRIAIAIEKVRKVWASLPGAGYNQPERSFTKLQAAYVQAGGTLSA
jgi:muramidase (phage lysozyme)